MEWFGRQLNSLSGNNLDVSYAYDQSGTRISKTVNGTKYEYQYESGKLFYEKRDKAEFYYLYDGLGNLTSIIHYDGNGNRAQYCFYMKKDSTPFYQSAVFFMPLLHTKCKKCASYFHNLHTLFYILVSKCSCHNNYLFIFLFIAINVILSSVF